jgi:hypothetical protein
MYLYLTVTVHWYHISEVPITNAMDSFSAKIGTHIPCTVKVGGLWCVCVILHVVRELTVSYKKYAFRCCEVIDKRCDSKKDVNSKHICACTSPANRRTQHFYPVAVRYA